MSSRLSILSRPDGTRVIVVGVARSGRALRRSVRFGESTPSVNRISRNFLRTPVADSLDGVQDSSTFECIEASGETVQGLNELVVASQTASGSTLCDGVTEPPLERYPDHRPVTPSPQPRTRRNPALSLETVAAPRGCVSPSVRTRTPLFFSSDEESDQDGGDGLEGDGLEDTFDANATSFSPPPQSRLSRSMQIMSPSSLYVWLSIHDGISEEVGVEKGIAPFLERTVDGGIQLRLDLTMLQWFDPANDAFITPQRLRSFFSRVPNVRVWTYRDPVPFSQCADAPLILGSIGPGVSSPELRMLGTPWRVSPVDGDRPHAARFFELVGSDTGGLLFVIFLVPSTLSPHHVPQSALPAAAPFPPCPSMRSMPPIETWNEVFAELRSLLQQLQS
ncbi:uncharacterized protein ARMOST_08290 [Armillaria ostoyae]|uniref:Uncharacterized protein n=1 Tax=Armillaria ostoyae TaxID=47428 RepID=A0A284R893_ARMOS|nr:uncharacterized protein ARMOST_08290 [Armillaria ostoyae]